MTNHKYTTNIPLAREKLETLAKTMRGRGHDEFARVITEDMLPLMTRKVSKKGMTKSQLMTPSLKREIRRYARFFPEKSHMEIATFFNVNIGQISEVLNA